MWQSILTRAAFLKSCLGTGLGAALMPPKAAKSELSYPCFSEDDYPLGKLLYENPLAAQQDTAHFILEGQARVHFPAGRMRMENLLDPALGQKSNFVYWCPENFPPDVAITWDFYPVREPGLCILFFSATGQKGEDLFDAALPKRTGDYGQYHHGGINAFHVSYFRRRYESERAFHLTNLRKSYGFHMVAQGADPIPPVADAKPPYRMKLVKRNYEIAFFINGLPVLHFLDDGKRYGPHLQGGKIGFRQMAPLIAEYSNLKVYAVS